MQAHPTFVITLENWGEGIRKDLEEIGISKIGI